MIYPNFLLISGYTLYLFMNHIFSITLKSFHNKRQEWETELDYNIYLTNFWSATIAFRNELKTYLS